MVNIMCACLLFSLQQDVEMPIPKYFINERAKALKEREKLLGQILAKLGPQDKDGVKNLFQNTNQRVI